MQIRYLGHAAFELHDDQTSVLIDPFLSHNPKATVDPADLSPDAILLTHGHPDHLGDTVAIATRTGAPVTAIHELAHELAEDGVEARGGNLGGTIEYEWGSVKLVPALHTAVSPKGTPHAPAGLLIDFKGTTVYHLGDTCLFSDLRLVGKRRPIDFALMCIGGHYTMDRFDAVDAAELVGASTVIPCHYDTLPQIETDAKAFQLDVERETSSSCVVLEPNEELSS